MTKESLPKSAMERFSLNNRVAVITGGAGKLGVHHAEAIMEAGGSVVLLDINVEKLRLACEKLSMNFQGIPIKGVTCDITDPKQVENARDQVLEKFGRIDILINNAANNPHVGDDAGDQKKQNFSRLEEFPLALWQKDLDVGLTGAFLCSKIFGPIIAKQNKGVILNISSDLSIIAPDQRLYRDSNLSENQQSVKPITYSVVKAGIIGLTRYLSTYWTGKGIRVNALSFGGVYSSDLDPEFVTRLENLIPMGRMASMDEYKSAIIFMASDASSYLTGQNVILDGGRSTW